MTSTPSTAGQKKTGIGDILMKLGPLMVLAILFVVFSVALPDKFLRVSNLMNILKQTSINCLIGSGMLLALITAGIDLSVGYNTILATCMIGVLTQNFGITNPFILIVSAIAISTAAGFVNGTLLTRLDLPHPFVSTLGMKYVFWGVALLITGSKTIGFTNKGIDPVLWIGKETVGSIGFPVSFLLILIVYAIFDVFLNHTALGRQIY
ncbi:MAG: ABC transporter permease, partial [Eubacteriales bacterium]|nr:ABC transporter permease [Eubacteriales bacterium]